MENIILPLVGVKRELGRVLVNAYITSPLLKEDLGGVILLISISLGRVGESIQLKPGIAGTFILNYTKFE